MLRNVGDFAGALGMCLALAYVPISTIGAVLQTVPLMITAAAALFLGERVGIRRLSAILVGFAGTLFIFSRAVPILTSWWSSPLSRPSA